MSDENFIKLWHKKQHARLSYEALNPKEFKNDQSENCPLYGTAY